MKRVLTLCLLTALAALSAAQPKPERTLNIIPEPVDVQWADSGTFRIERNALVRIMDADLRTSADYLARYMEEYLGIPLQVEAPARKKVQKKQPAPAAAVTLKNARNGKTSGGYHLSISAEEGVTIEGNDAAGVFYGVQTLTQLLPTRAGDLALLPLVEIDDYPRFAYRGMHLDVVRHFFPVSFIKKYLDSMAKHKLNYFHWHLTDDQGWRIAMNCRPELTETGAYREGEIEGYYPGRYREMPYGGYYTHDDVREVIRYAEERHITVIPEIDIPGHCMAVLATYPHFSTTPDEEKKCALTWGIYNKHNNVLAPKPEVFRFLTDVFTELCDLFPGPYIHLGGDECAKKWWQQSEQAQQFMRENNLPDEKALQSYFVHYVQQVVESKGKTVIGWDEVLEGGISTDCVVMNWRRPAHGVKALQTNHKTIFTCSGWSYFNAKESRTQQEIGPRGPLPAEKVYGFEIVPDSLTEAERSLILGVQGCLWTEYVQNTWKAEFAVFPRMAALAENAWSAPERKSWERFVGKIPTQLDRYELWGVRYSTAILRREDIPRER